MVEMERLIQVYNEGIVVFFREGGLGEKNKDMHIYDMSIVGGRGS